MPRNTAPVGSTRITTATTTQVASGPCVLKRIVFSVPVATGTVNVIDGQAGTTSTHGVVTTTADVKPFVVEYDCRMTSGIRIVTTQAQDILVVWDK